MLGLIARQYIKYRVAPELELNKLEFVTLEGNPADLSQYKGKHILLSYFATWCGPCNAEMAPMEAARPILEQNGFVLVHVSDEEVNKINSFIAKHPSGIEYLRSAKPLDEIGVHTYPTHFVFDKNGSLRFKQTNPLDWEDPITIAKLVKLVE